MTCVEDLVVRMTCKEPQKRLVIAEVVSHLALWDAETKLRHGMDWHKSWERGAPALGRRLQVNAGLLQRLIGDRTEGWLAKLEPRVVDQLTADCRH